MPRTKRSASHLTSPDGTRAVRRAVPGPQRSVVAAWPNAYAARLSGHLYGLRLADDRLTDADLLRAAEAWIAARPRPSLVPETVTVAHVRALLRPPTDHGYRPARTAKQRRRDRKSKGGSTSADRADRVMRTRPV